MSPNKNPARWQNHDFIVIVSGLPRSGTSMMMRMLEFGGIKIVADHIRQADQDNPKGYYEFERVKKIREDTSWLEECRGKAVKMVSELLYYLPSDKHYKIIFMERELEEIYLSQQAMLKRLGREGANIDKERLISLFKKHIKRSKKWLSSQRNIKVIYVNYNDMIASPQRSIEEINSFFDNKLDVDRMCKVVDKSLYRQRKC